MCNGRVTGAIDCIFYVQTAWLQCDLAMIDVITIEKFDKHNGSSVGMINIVYNLSYVVPFTYCCHTERIFGDATQEISSQFLTNIILEIARLCNMIIDNYEIIRNTI